MSKKSFSFRFSNRMRPPNYSIYKENEKHIIGKSQKDLKIHKKKSEEIKEGNNKKLSIAYKNVIKVISNLLDNIEDEITNGKSNLKYINETNRKQKTRQISLKKPIKKLISQTPPKSRISLVNKFSAKNFKKKLSSPASIEFKSNKTIKNKFDLNNKSSSNKLNLNDLNASQFFDKKRNTNYNSKIKSSKRKINIFFKPKNKLKTKFTSEKHVISDIFLNNNSKSSNDFSSKIILDDKYKSLLLDSDKKIKLNKNYNLFSSNSITTSKLKSNIAKSTISKIGNIKKNVSPFDILQKNIKIHTEIIKQKLYEYENNEITHEINQLPGNELLMKKKRLHKKKSEFNFGKKIKKIICLKPLRNNFEKTMARYNKESKFRILFIKGHVYDSLDDDEESDEEDIDYCYFEPNSRFVFILDCITFASALIMLLYYPICLAKNKYFCLNVRKKDSILFHVIDIIYIFDLIINFYKAYYNYNDILIKKNILIFIHYCKTWFLLDLISAIPIYTIIKSNESKCLNDTIYFDYKFNYIIKHSQNYDTNLYRMHYLLSFLKVIKIFKVFKNNIAAKKFKKKINHIDFFYDWGNVFLYAFFFVCFLNFGACFFIFLGRNSSNNWIFSGGFQTKSFMHMYIGAIQYLVETVTTVGYGELVGSSLNEILFQIIMLILGTCIYSWLISSISNYVTKKNVNNIKYEEKVQILEEIKLNNPNFPEKLYDKILRLLHYRKYHEEETEKNIVLDSLPNSLKNSLIIEMYKSFIDGFLFFKNIENREFIVQVISKLKPVLGIKGDTIVKEGEYIEDIIFVKNGILSLEVWIDMIYPEDSIENYLTKYDFINILKKKHKKRSSFKKEKYKKIKNKKTSNNNFYESSIIEHNKKKIKILDIRRNEHFGDVFMFLNKKSPLYVRVKSNKADLLLLRKLDALDISHNYPDIWKTIIKKPLANAKIVHNLTLKMLAIFCNFHGIKTKLFKKKKNNRFYPSYYLMPVVTSSAKNKNLTEIKKHKEGFILNESRERINLSLKNYIKSVSIKTAKKFKEELNENTNTIETNTLEENDNNEVFEEENDGDFSPKKKRKPRKIFSLFNSKNNVSDKDNSSTKQIDNLLDDSKSQKTEDFFSSKNRDRENSMKRSRKSSFHKSTFGKENEDYDNTPKSKASDFFKKHQNNNYKIIINNPEEVENIIKDNDNSSKESQKMFNFNINDEIYPGEKFNLELVYDENKKQINDNKKIVSNNININNRHEYLSEPVYINNLNIIGTLCNGPEEKKNLEQKIKKLELELSKKKNFNKLEISSSESTLEINSSYENINVISNNQYITNNSLRNLTKEFIRNNIINSKSTIDYNFEERKKSALSNNNNNKFLDIEKFFDKKNKNNRSRSLILSKLSSGKKNNKIKEKNKSNRMAHKYFQSIVHRPTSQMQAKDFLNKVRNYDSSTTNLRQVKRSSVKNESSNKDNFFTSKRKSNTFTDNEEENYIKKEKNRIKDRKKKKKNELDIISLNIQKSSQNLNQPDIFYAGLFSQLLFKGTSKEDDNKNIDEENNNEKDKEENEQEKNSNEESIEESNENEEIEK